MSQNLAVCNLFVSKVGRNPPAAVGADGFHAIVHPMGEFLARWVWAGIVAASILYALGVRGAGPSVLVLGGAWIGFWNAALRPFVLRLPAAGNGLLALLFAALAVLNGVLFLTLGSWLPITGGPGRGAVLLAALAVTGCSWAASSRFRTRDGRWHWITFHGSVSKRAPKP